MTLEGARRTLRWWVLDLPAWRRGEQAREVRRFSDIWPDPAQRAAALDTARPSCPEAEGAYNLDLIAEGHCPVCCRPLSDWDIVTRQGIRLAICEPCQLAWRAESVAPPTPAEVDLRRWVDGEWVAIPGVTQVEWH
jgi:hypothetical protein